MATYNRGGQWTLQKTDEDLMFKKPPQKEHPLSADFDCDGGPKLKKGEVPRRPTDQEVAQYILTGRVPQPTDEELFGHLVVTEEQLQKSKEQWEDFFKNHFEALKKPIEQQDSQDNTDWGSGKSFNSSLSPEELKARNMYTGE